MSLAPFDLNLRHLRALSAIVARGSISRAADAVGLSQPALTQGLAKLEAQLGATLFDRRTDGMAATAAGRALAERAEAAVAHLSAAARVSWRGRGLARPERMMTSTQLGAFLAFADAGSFVGGARSAGLSQPALHRAVRDLEALGGVPLVDRRGRGVALTAPGRRLARGVRLAAAEIAAGIAEVLGDEASDAPLRIGAMPLCRARLLPAALSALVRERPATRVDVVEGSWRELVEPLRDGEIDLMIGALRPDEDPELDQRPLFEDRLAVIARAGHPLAGSAAPPLDALAAHGWIAGRAGTPLRAQWEALFAGRHLPPAPIECGSVMAIRGLLQASDFLTLLSPEQVALEMASGVLAQVGPPLAASVRTIGVTTRRGWRPRPAQARLLVLLDAITGTRPLSE